MVLHLQVLTVKLIQVRGAQIQSLRSAAGPGFLSYQADIAVIWEDRKPGWRSGVEHPRSR